MNCVLCSEEAGVVKTSKNNNQFGLCFKHAHLNEQAVNNALFKRTERTFLKALLYGV